MSKTGKAYHTFHDWSLGRILLLTLPMLLIAAVAFIGVHRLVLDLDLDHWQGSRGYDVTARSIVEQGLYSENGATMTLNRPPLYPAYLAIFHKALGPRAHLGAYIGQALMYVVTGLLLIVLSWRLFHQPLTTLLTALLYVFHIEFAIEALSLRDTLLFSCILACLIAQWGRKPTAWRMLLWALLSALLYLTRPTGVVLPFLAPWWLLPWIRQNSWPRLLQLAGTFWLGFALFTLPWHLFVWQQTHDLSLLPSSTSGENLYKGHFKDFSTLYPWVDLDDYNPWIDQLTAGLSESERNQLLKDKGWEAIFQDPLAALSRCGIKFLALYSPLRTPLGEADLVQTDDGVVLENFRLNTLPFIMLPHAMIMLLGALAFILSWKQLTAPQRAFLIQALGFLLAVTAIHLLTFGETRHRLPLDMIFIPMAAAFFARLWSRHKTS